MPFFWKSVALVAVPFGVVTVIGPVLRPVPATTTNCVAEAEVTDLTGTPPIVMLVKPVKFVPVIVTVVPELPLVGVKLVIVGAGATTVTVKLAALVAVPPPVVTLIKPLAGAKALIEVPPAPIAKDAAVAPNLTLVAPPKLAPLITTSCPTGPLAGEKPLMLGAGNVTVKLVALVAEPPTVVTLIGPLVAPTGTVALIDVAESTV